MTEGARLLGRNRRLWLAVAAALLAGIAAAVVPPPPAVGGAGGRSVFAALASAAIVVFAILPFMLWRRAAQPILWVAAALVALALGIGSFFTSGYVERTPSPNIGYLQIVFDASNRACSRTQKSDCAYEITHSTVEGQLRLLPG